MRQAAIGDTVRVHYSGTLEDGSEFDKSAPKKPLELKIGEGEIFSTLEDNLVGMAAGETNSVTLGPDEAYGDRDPGLVVTVPRDRIPAKIQLEIGTALQAADDNGDTMHMVVVDLTDADVTLDANHPLAGQTLTFALTLVEFVG